MTTMTRSQVFKKLEERHDAIKRFGVMRLGLFGSASRDTILEETVDVPGF